jgi:hypothetical protein
MYTYPSYCMPQGTRTVKEVDQGASLPAFRHAMSVSPSRLVDAGGAALVEASDPRYPRLEGAPCFSCFHPGVAPHEEGSTQGRQSSQTAQGPCMASAAGQKRSASEMAAGGSEDEAPWSTSFTVRCFGHSKAMHTQMLRWPCGACLAPRAPMHACPHAPMRLPCSCMHADLRLCLLLLLSRCRSGASRTSAR